MIGDGEHARVIRKMMTIIGDGGHANVVREVADICDIKYGYFVAVGENKARKREAEHLGNVYFPALIHPKAYVSPSAQIGAGTIVMPGAIINTGAIVGKHCILNSCSVLEHDSVTQDFVHLAPGAIVCGGVRIGEGAMIGANGTVLQYTHVPAWYRLKSNNIFHYGKLKTEESFWAKVQKSNECWIWMGARNHSGYGIVSKRSGNILAHRVAWVMVNGQIQNGLNVLHKCDVRECVNPDHLFLGTQKENIRDMVAKGRHRGGYTKEQRAIKKGKINV